MQKIANLDAWTLVTADDAIGFPVARTVTLEVMTPVGTDWLIVRKNNGESQNPTYLTTTSGKETIQVTLPAETTLIPSNTVRYRDKGRQAVHMERPEGVNFAEIMEPDARDPEVERMINKHLENHFRRQNMLNMQRDIDNERRVEAMLQAQIERGEVDPETGEINDEPKTEPAPEPTVQAQAPTSTAPAAQADGRKGAPSAQQAAE